VALRTAGDFGCHGRLVQPCCLELAKGFVQRFRREAVHGRKAGVLLRRSDHPRNVLGHESQGGQPITMAFHGPLDALGRHPTPNVVGQRRPAMIRRKRQFVDVAGIMVMPYSFSMSPSPLHANHRHNDGHCRTSQRWHPA